MKKVLLLAVIAVLISSCEEECEECQTCPEISDQQFTISENSINGTIVDTVISQENVSFEIINGNTESAFQIDKEHGIISVNNSNALDYEQNSSFQLAVEITDNSYSLSNTAIIEITLIDISIPTEGIVGLYQFEDDYNDLSSLNNHGVNYNTLLMNTDMYSEDNKAAYLTGHNSYIKLPTDFDLAERTISIWFNASQISGTQRLYYSDHSDLEFGSTNIDLTNDLAAGTHILRMECGGGQGDDLVIEIEENRWYNAVLTISSDSVKAYINGTIYDKTIVSSHHSDAGNPNAYIGCNRFEDNYFYNGLIDNLTIYNRILSEDEITILFKE